MSPIGGVAKAQSCSWGETPPTLPTFILSELSGGQRLTMKKPTEGDWVHCNFRDEEGIVVRDFSQTEGCGHWLLVLFAGRDTPARTLGFNLLVLERAEDNKNES